ncbi:hypothetical protein C3920_10340, partial [Novacetimonas pomaceti]
MKTKIRTNRALWAFPACVTMACLSLAGCESVRDQIADRENSLAAAGFVARPANTPERQEMLQ